MFTIRALPWGTAVVIDDTELVKQVFTGDPAVYHAGDGNSLLAPVLGERSVLVLDEDQHLQARKRLLPPFHGESVRRYGEVIEEIVEEEIERWPVGEPFALHPRMQAITLEVILKAVIGVTDPARLRALRETLPAAVPTDPKLMAIWVVPGLDRIGRWRRFRQTVDEANRLLREEIAARRADLKLAEREDVLSQLVRAGATDDEELRDQIMTLLLAGHETTTTGLAWTFERLLRHPQALARARDHTAEDNDAYLDAVIQEALRVRPVIPAVLRQLQAPVELGGYRLPAGVTVMPAITLLHSDPELFGEPLRFKPERFLEGGEGSTYTWIPFGGGRRRCLGAAFASFEMRVALRTILRRTRLRADRPDSERVRNHHITLIPARGARVLREA
jgi:cytochrome P450 family 135